MRCLSCKKPMVVLEYDRIEIDHCVFCGCAWLDKGELELLLGHAKENVDIPRSAGEDGCSREKRRRCPFCRKAMKKVLYGPSPGVLLDGCSRHGLWFDRGEMKRIFELAHVHPEDKTFEFIRSVFTQ